MYNELSLLYDQYMEEVPYKKWFENIEHYLAKYNKNPNTVLDLGCGTGTMALMLSEQGYNVTAIDLSEDMLAVASQKAFEANKQIIFSNQDMCSFSLPCPVDLIISLCDCINYITTNQELLQVFKNCYNNLNSGGMLIFDINSIYKLKDVLGFTSFCQTSEGSAVTCENYFDKDSFINEYYVNIFIKTKSGKYERFEEYHYEKAYSTEEIIFLLKQAGFSVYETADANTLSSVTPTTERIYFLAGKD